MLRFRRLDPVTQFSVTACDKTMAQMGGRFLDFKNDAISLRMSRSLRVWSLKPRVSRRVRRVPDEASVTSCPGQNTVPFVELSAFYGSDQHLRGLEPYMGRDHGRSWPLPLPWRLQRQGNESRLSGTRWTWLEQDLGSAGDPDKICGTEPFGEER